jgi:hypothetical protein
MGGAGGGVGGIEIRLNNDRLALDGVYLKQLDSLARARGSIGSFNEAYLGHGNLLIVFLLF